jgi:hypothetical protein
MALYPPIVRDDPKNDWLNMAQLTQLVLISLSVPPDYHLIRTCRT